MRPANASALPEPIEVILTAIELTARDTNLFTFARPNRGPLPPAEAGAHIGLNLPGSIERQYSLVHPHSEPRSYTVGVKREASGGGGSRAVHELRVGARLTIEPPRNNFPLDMAAEKTVLIAGGIGVTPIFCMMQALDAAGRDWTLYYSARSREDAALIDWLDGRERVRFHFDDEAGGYFPMGSVIVGIPPEAHLYCCGPAPMLAAFEAACAGRPPANVHVEYFTAKHAAATEGGFTVELAKTGGEFGIPAGKSILHVLQEAGIDVASSCEEGVCGACETRVISGTPDHRDAILSDDERLANETMMICCSGCKSDRLVLDL